MSNNDMMGMTQQQLSNNSDNNHSGGGHTSSGGSSSNNSASNNNNSNSNNSNNPNSFNSTAGNSNNNNSHGNNSHGNNSHANNSNSNTSNNSHANNSNSNNSNNSNGNNANANNNSSTSGGESKSIMQQVASQEKRIVELNKALTDRNQTLAKFQTEKKTEMEALMSGMRQWIGNLDVKNEGHKDEFEKGLQRLVDTSSFDNGVWQVMVSASACAAKKEEDYQALKTQYEALNQQKGGGVFGNADERVGGKRAATGDPEQDSGAAPDIWSSFIADVSTSGYPHY
jgi:hypothetical protein